MQPLTTSNSENLNPEMVTFFKSHTFFISNFQILTFYQIRFSNPNFPQILTSKSQLPNLFTICLSLINLFTHSADSLIRQMQANGSSYNRGKLHSFTIK